MYVCMYVCMQACIRLWLEPRLQGLQLNMPRCHVCRVLPLLFLPWLAFGFSFSRELDALVTQPAGSSSPVPASQHVCYSACCFKAIVCAYPLHVCTAPRPAFQVCQGTGSCHREAISTVPCRPRARDSLRRRRRPPHLAQACFAPVALHQSLCRRLPLLPEGVLAPVGPGRSLATPLAHDFLPLRRRAHGDLQAQQPGDGVVLARHPRLAHTRGLRRLHQWFLFELQLDHLLLHPRRQPWDRQPRLYLPFLLRQRNTIEWLWRPALERLPLYLLPLLWGELGHGLRLPRHLRFTWLEAGRYAWRQWMDTARYHSRWHLLCRLRLPRPKVAARERRPPRLLRRCMLLCLPQRWSLPLPHQPCQGLIRLELMLPEAVISASEPWNVSSTCAAPAAHGIASCSGLGTLATRLGALLPDHLLEARGPATRLSCRVLACRLAFPASVTELLPVRSESDFVVCFRRLHMPSWAVSLLLSLWNCSALSTAQVSVWRQSDTLRAILPVVLSPVQCVLSTRRVMPQVACWTCRVRTSTRFCLTVPRSPPCLHSPPGSQGCSGSSWHWTVTDRQTPLPVNPATKPNARQCLSFSQLQPAPPHAQSSQLHICIVRGASPVLSPVCVLLGPSGYSGPWHSCALLHFCGAWWLQLRRLLAFPKLRVESRFFWHCGCLSSDLRPRRGPLPFLAPGQSFGYFSSDAQAHSAFVNWGSTILWALTSIRTGSLVTCPGSCTSGWGVMPPRRDPRAQPWSEAQVAELDCTTLHPAPEAICTLRNRLLLVLPHAAGTHSSDGLTYNVRVIGQQPSKIYAINRDHLESPDDDTPRPRVQDDGLLGPRLRWRLYPPPLTLFTAPVLLGWRHLPQADSFFWRRDVEDSALAKYSGGDSIAAHSDVRVDDATQSPDSFEDVLVEEPGPDAEAVTPMPEEEMPMYIQAGDVRLSSNDYRDDDYQARPTATARRRSRSRRRSSVKQRPAKHDAKPDMPASSSSSRGAFPPDPPLLEPSVAMADSAAAVNRATAKSSAWTIPQWARKAINKRLKERRAQLPSAEPPPRPRGKSIWFTSDDEDADAGQAQHGCSSLISRVKDPAMSDTARSSRDAYMSAVCQSPLAWVSLSLCFPAPPVSLLSPRLGEMWLGLRRSAAVAYSALGSCVCLLSGSFGVCTTGSGQLEIVPPSWLLEDMPGFWRKVLLRDRTGTCLTRCPSQILAVCNVGVPFKIACVWQASGLHYSRQLF